MNNFKQGASVTITARVRNHLGVLVDPDLVKFSTYREADAVKTIYTYDAPDVSSDSSDSEEGEVFRVSTGVYRITFTTAPQSGLWRWRFKSLGPDNADQGQFYVEPREIDDDSSSESDDSSS